MRTAGVNRWAGRAAPPACLVAVLFALPALCRAAAPDRDVRLLAHGSRELYWIARVYDDAERGTSVTDVYSRSAAGAEYGAGPNSTPSSIRATFELRSEMAPRMPMFGLSPKPSSWRT